MTDDVVDLARPSAGWAQRRERVMLELERTALELIIERGYEAVTYEDIARRSGCSSRTVYRYFPTKELFLLVTPRRAAALSVAAVQEIRSSAHPVDDYFETLIRLIEEHAGNLGDVLLWSRALRELPEDVANRVRAERAAAIRETVLGLCAESLSVERDNIGAVATAAAIAAVNQAVVELWIDADGKDDLRALIASAVDGLRSSLRPRRRPRQS